MLTNILLPNMQFFYNEMKDRNPNNILTNILQPRITWTWASTLLMTWPR